MVNIKTAFPSKWLSEPDLNGNPMVVTIDRIEFESMSGDGEIKPVVYFREATKGLVMNKTNANTIMDIVGNPETDSWKGWAIELFPFITEFNGRMTPCIRVRKPAAPQPAIAPVAGQPVATVPVVAAVPNMVAGDPGPQAATDYQQ